MRRWWLWAWRWSWLLTLPITLVFVYWAYATAERYATFGVRYESSFGLRNVGLRVLNNLANRARFSVSPWLQLKRRDSQVLRTVHLFVAEPELAKLDENLPHSGFNYVEGGLWYQGKTRRVKVRYRGDFVNHWGFVKKSFRVKTRKKRLFEGLRSFNLIVPKFPAQMNSALGYALASELGLIAPRSEMVNLVLNGKWHGLYLLVEQLDESTLRRHNRMPGDLYAGEMVAKDSYRGVFGPVFDHPGLWTKIAVNNHYPEASRAPLNRLLGLVRSPSTADTMMELSELLDMDAWGRFSAFETLATSYHYDNMHNWRLYYDPAASRFLPVVWDPAAWAPGWHPDPAGSTSPDLLPSQLHRVLFQNSDFLAARARAFQEFFSAERDRAFLDKVRQLERAVTRAVELDENMRLPTDWVLTEVRGFGKLLEKVFADLRATYLDSPASTRFSVSGQGQVIAFTVDGRRPLTRLALQFSDPVVAITAAKLRYWRNGEAVETDVSGNLRHQGARLELDTLLLARHVRIARGGHSPKVRPIKILPAYYELVLDGGGETGGELIDVLADRSTGRLEPAQRVPALEPGELNDMFPVVRPAPVARPIIWRGLVELHGQTRIDGNLVIEPGTTVRLHPGAGLVLRGRLSVRGSQDHPVRFLPATPGQAAWGALVLLGEGADGSSLSHCEFAGGSGLKTDLFEYSAMFSVHGVSSVVVDQCTFRDSRDVDDMVHAVYADIRFSRTRFERSRADALDLDISSAEIDDCVFVESGNDAIDLMTSKVVVKGTLLQDSGDKGISVGEGSRLLAIDNRIARNDIGVQAKDGSVATLYNVELSENRLPLDAYKKNWRYADGGRIVLYKGLVRDNLDLPSADKHSAIWIYDSYLDRSPAESAERVHLGATVDSQSPTSARKRELWRFAEERERMRGIGEGYWRYADPERRGVVSLAN